MLASEVVASALGFPEGPLALPDGRVAFVEQYCGRVAVAEDGRVATLARTGGSPAGLALGPDGRLYVTLGRGVVGNWMSSDPRTPAILAVAVDSGEVEVVVTQANGKPLRAPNDLCFGPDGALYFTDPADYAPGADVTGWICRAENGAAEILYEVGNTFPNGAAFDAGGALVWVETRTRRVVRASGTGLETLAELEEPATPDGCAFTNDGRLLVATFAAGGITIVDWSEGEARAEELVWSDDVVPTNCAFAGSTLWVTDVGRDWDNAGTPGGRLWRVETTLQGQALAG